MSITPQEKKIRDYTNQRKNAYCENDKSSRNAIRKRKRWVNRAYRKSIKNIVRCSSFNEEQIDDLVAKTEKHGWKKFPNTLIIDLLDNKWAGSSRTKSGKYSVKLRNQAKKRIVKSKSKTGI